MDFEMRGEAARLDRFRRIEMALGHYIQEVDDAYDDAYDDTSLLPQAIQEIMELGNYGGRQFFGDNVDLFDILQCFLKNPAAPDCPSIAVRDSAFATAKNDAGFYERMLKLYQERSFTRESLAAEMNTGSEASNMLQDSGIEISPDDVRLLAQYLSVQQCQAALAIPHSEYLLATLVRMLDGSIRMGEFELSNQMIDQIIGLSEDDFVYFHDLVLAFKRYRQFGGAYSLSTQQNLQVAIDEPKSFYVAFIWLNNISSSDMGMSLLSDGFDDYSSGNNFLTQSNMDQLMQSADFLSQDEARDALSDISRQTVSRSKFNTIVGWIQQRNRDALVGYAREQRRECIARLNWPDYLSQHIDNIRFSDILLIDQLYKYYRRVLQDANDRDALCEKIINHPDKDALVYLATYSPSEIEDASPDDASFVPLDALLQVKNPRQIARLLQVIFPDSVTPWARGELGLEVSSLIDPSKTWICGEQAMRLLWSSFVLMGVRGGLRDVSPSQRQALKELEKQMDIPLDGIKILGNLTKRPLVEKVFLALLKLDNNEGGRRLAQVESGELDICLVHVPVLQQLVDEGSITLGRATELLRLDYDHVVAKVQDVDVVANIRRGNVTAESVLLSPKPYLHDSGMLHEWSDSCFERALIQERRIERSGQQLQGEAGRLISELASRARKSQVEVPITAQSVLLQEENSHRAVLRMNFIFPDGVEPLTVDEKNQVELALNDPSRSWLYSDKAMRLLWSSFVLMGLKGARRNGSCDQKQELRELAKSMGLGLHGINVLRHNYGERRLVEKIFLGLLRLNNEEGEQRLAQVESGDLDICLVHVPVLQQLVDEGSITLGRATELLRLDYDHVVAQLQNVEVVASVQRGDVTAESVLLSPMLHRHYLGALGDSYNKPYFESALSEESRLERSGQQLQGEDGRLVSELAARARKLQEVRSVGQVTGVAETLHRHQPAPAEGGQSVVADSRPAGAQDAGASEARASTGASSSPSGSFGCCTVS